ncbi:MAG: hypothetical protein QM496_07400 [Verrucomicrobiota bacterium]
MKPILIILITLFAFSQYSKAQQTYDWEHGAVEGVKLNTVTFRAWLPKSDDPIRGTLILIPGRHGDGRGMAETSDWQEVAESVNFAIMACQFADGDKYLYQNDSDQILCGVVDEALMKLAKLSGHEEIGVAPVAFWGTSAGSNFSSHYCNYKSKRVAAFASSKGTFGPNHINSRAKSYIPMFFAIGKNDRKEWVDVSLKNYNESRNSQSPWTLALHPAEGHGVGKSKALAQAWLTSVLRQRLGLPPNEQRTPSRPSSLSSNKMKPIKVKEGWLGDPETLEIAAYNDFKKRKKEATWLPDENVALAWKAYLISE